MGYADLLLIYVHHHEFRMLDELLIKSIIILVTDGTVEPVFILIDDWFTVFSNRI